MERKIPSEPLLYHGRSDGPRGEPMHEGPMGRGRQARVLIVEDDRTCQLLGSRVIRMVGADPMLASNGQEGLEMFRETRPDLVMTDMHMPLMDGLEMLQEIMRIDPSARAMVVSGNLKTEQEIALYDAGALIILPKPCGIAEMERAVRYCLGGSG